MSGRRFRPWATLALLTIALLSLPLAQASIRLDPRPIDPAASAWTGVPVGGAPLELLGAAPLPLGDINADGFADVLVPTVGQGGQLVLQALQGPDLTSVAWEIADAGRLVAAVDLDADGALDVLLRQVESVGQGAAQGVPGLASGGAASAAGDQVLQVLSGATGAVQVAQTVAGEATGLVLETALGTVTVVSAVQGFIGPAVGGVLVVQETVRSLAPALEGATGLLRQTDAVLRVLDGAGNLVLEVARTDPASQVLQVTTRAISQAGAAATVVLESIETAQAAGAALSVARVAVQAAGAAWETTLDAAAGVPMLLPNVGDLNADGLVEVAVAQLPPPDAGVMAATTVLDGATGNVLGTVERAGSLVSLVPLQPVSAAAGAAAGALGGVAGAAGAASTAASSAVPLLIATATQAGTVLQGATSALEVVWTLQLPAGVLPINAVLDTVTGDLAGLTDLTGDGVADVLTLATTASGTVLRLVDTLTGEEVWALESAAALTHAVADFTGDLLGDVLLLVERASGPVLELASGATGELLWSLPIGSPVPAAMSSHDGDGETYLLTPVGDVDGDGAGDVVLTVADPAAPTQSFNNHLVSGSQGDVEASSGPAETLPAPEKSAPAGDEEDAGGRDTPSLGLVGALAAIGAVLLLRRRA